MPVFRELVLDRARETGGFKGAEENCWESFLEPSCETAPSAASRGSLWDRCIRSLLLRAAPTTSAAQPPRASRAEPGRAVGRLRLEGPQGTGGHAAGCRLCRLREAPQPLSAQAGRAAAATAPGPRQQRDKGGARPNRDMRQSPARNLTGSSGLKSTE